MTRSRYTMPHLIGPALARTHIVLNNTPPLHAMSENDEVVTVDARDLNPGDAVKRLIKATGWPFCLDDSDGVNDVEGGAM